MDRRSYASLILASMVFLMAVQGLSVLADPDPVDSLTVTKGGSYNAQATGYGIGAQAGNVTALVMTNIRSTEFWQGYYGNITGDITLDDANNNTLFSWGLANPSGEIYATNSSATVLWANITCVNLTNATSGSETHAASKINRSSIQSAYNLTDQDYDNMSSTFNQTFSSTLVVGPRTITSTDGCPQLNTYIDDAFQTSNFNELLLFDNDSALVFTAIIEKDGLDGFEVGSGDVSDFQMMVLEDGTPGGPDASITTYYFYVELD